MDLFPALNSPAILVFVLAVAMFAGVVKGLVGFAMPMVMISGLTLVVPPEQALAALILPTLITNVWQAMRQGIVQAWRSALKFKVFLGCGLIMLLVSAQLVRTLDTRFLYVLIGAPIAVFGALQLAGWRPRLNAQSARVEVVAGGVAGFIGGLSGIWGPPTVAYLTAIDTPKADQMRAQGAIYGFGAIALGGAHLQTGVLRAETLPLTLAILPFAIAGTALGFKLQDRIDQQMFRKLTLIVLVIAGLNLLRRAVTG